ncbi:MULTISPECIES: NACHT domain-containing protein [Klebsiella/Raoultella group]|uniref:NACHT domain-containing protein n=1 Tax=Klebsiella/Raoultella group TaxID=2890311 RepID=UPI001A91AADF|nr:MULTISPECIES: ATP-binding protein [Klebsiella/Raoultella group]HDZ9517924.1 ATP-binding protein [Klebsiella pneumoniae]
MMIKRTFKEIPDGKIKEANQQSFLVGLGWARGTTWDDLLQSKRVLIISEAGAGKTYECRTQAKRLWTAGEPAFFVELAALATEELRSLLDVDEEARLDAWLISQFEVATFFLDSIDELKLTHGSFERALRRLKKCIGNQLHRARIVITTRPVPFDEQLVRNILPVPHPQSLESNEETFAKIAMGEHQGIYNKRNEDQSPDWRSVALMPLSDEQIIQFSRDQGVKDPDQLMEDLHRRNAQEFAWRPQDLIELCTDWLEHKRIRTHRDQVATNVRVKLLPRDERPELAELSIDKAIEGASRLALAVQMTRRLTIRHSSASDVVSEEAALDPAIILSDWQPNERKALLERPLFGFASYGRVRFHHRSVAEFLAAERLIYLRAQGMTFRALKRLIFAETKGKTIVRPSKRPVAGWLALREEGIFELLRDNEPAVLLDEGDPESLTRMQRAQALHAYANRYGPGGWRGLQVPQIQVHRFASKDLADVISRIWHRGIENPDVREVIIKLIEAGQIENCSDIAFDITHDTSASAIERITAIDALVALGDQRLREIVLSIADANKLWPDSVAQGAVLRLFPNYMSVEQLCQTLKWLKQEKRGIGNFYWQLPRLIAASPLDHITLEKLRDCLVILVSEGLKWREKRPHITSRRSYLSEALAATCEHGLDTKQDEWLYASVLALRLHYQDHYGNDEAIKYLRERLSNLNAVDNERLFWVDDALLQSLHEVKDPWNRLAEIIIHDGPVQLRPDRDLIWTSEALADTTRNLDERAMLLEAAIRLSPDCNTLEKHVEGLRPLVADEYSFVQRLDDCLKPSKYYKKHCLSKKKQAKRKEQEERRKAKNRASWVLFWREITNKPEDAFSSEKGLSTVWNLWKAMSHDGDNSRSSGWNRYFIEKQFNSQTADKLRCALMKVWRNDHPTFPSERPENERNTFLIRWQLGLTAIYAEAEDHEWASKLSDAEAQLAARFALIETNGLPQWIESLACMHPNAVEQMLGNELSWELNQPPSSHGHSSLLQGIEYASERVARLFLPRLESWLETACDRNNIANNTTGMTERVRQVTRVFYHFGDAGKIEILREHAHQRLELQLPFALRLVWLSTLMKIDPQAGIEILEGQNNKVTPFEPSEIVTCLAALFGDIRRAISLGDKNFTPQLLLRLLRLAYCHVRIQDDVLREESCATDTRDNAKQARNNIVTALFNAKGEEGLAAKLEMAMDPMCAHFKDRILAVAEENWAQEIDAEVFDEVQAQKLDRSWEAPATTNEAMFTIMKDRLSDLDDLLLHDVSPREAWAAITDEKVMRREIARELRHASNLIYTVDQEAVTADEKETDIRLRSILSKHEAVIELKLGDRRTARDLLDTIEHQLVKKYMAAEHSKAGALLVTLSKERQWEHPVEKYMMKADELLYLLSEEALRVQEALGGGIYIYVHLLDLRTRLPVESQVK